MEKGRIIFLNGVTSAGKTSIVKAFQERTGEFYYALSNDLFQETVGLKHLTQSAEQAALMADNIEYKLSVDTSLYSSEECADTIIKTLLG